MSRAKNEIMRFSKGGKAPKGQSHKGKQLTGRKVTIANSASVPSFSQHFQDKHLDKMPKNGSKAQKEALIEANAQKDKRLENDYFMTSGKQRAKAGMDVSKGQKTFQVRARHVETHKGIIQRTPDTAKKHSYEITGATHRTSN